MKNDLENQTPVAPSENIDTRYIRNHVIIFSIVYYPYFVIVILCFFLIKSVDLYMLLEYSFVVILFLTLHGHYVMRRYNEKECELVLKYLNEHCYGIMTDYVDQRLRVLKNDSHN